ncbi:MAG: amino acid permease [Gammaproteobacteria bacterium]|nr:amino acid permease [Gammaproteobacteria bacterium]MDE2350054.1 amino acid permease [Gammaproteobacteria bacterium]
MKLSGLFATKPISDYHEEAAGKNLVRALGTPSLIAFGIGGIIGTGIFVLTGLAAAQHAGPAIVISFVIAGIGCMFAGLCYSEFATMVPVAGSAYAYSYATLGESIAWFVGWNLVLEYMMACSVVAVGWSRYFVKLLDYYGINVLPGSLTSAPFAAADVGIQVHQTGAFLNLPAIGIIAAATALCYKGIQESTFVNTVIVAIKVSIVLAVIVFGAFYVDTAHWVPFIPKNTGKFGEFGWSGIIQAAGIIFFAYIGFDGVSTVAQESKNPSRGMPIGILGSLGICTILYILMSGVMTGMVPYPALNDAAPVAVAIESHHQLHWLTSWVIWGALLGLTSVIITMIIPQARIWLTMAHDGLLPPIFGAVHPKYRTPHISTVITGVLAATFAGLLPIGILGELVSIGTLIAFIVVCAGVLVLRYTRPDLPRPFRVPAVWFVSIMGIVFCAGMAVFLPAATWVRLALWSLIGLVLYFAYGYRHSRLRRKDEAATAAKSASAPV